MSEANTQSIIGELRQLADLAEEVNESLKAQKEILQKRGMNLPPMVTRSLSDVKEDLSRVQNMLMDEQTELGQLRALADMSANINTSFDLDHILEEAMDVVITLTGAERGYIILKNEATNELEFRVSRDNELGAGFDKMDGGVQISRTILQEVMASGQAMLTDNAYKDERLQGNVSIANFALRSVLAVPLNYKGDAVGVVYVDNRMRAGIFQEREKNLLMAFANTAAVAIANARLFASIQDAVAEITEVKQLMDNVFASISSGVIATDSSDLVTTFTPPAERILDRESEKSIGQRLNAILPKSTVAELDVYLDEVREKKENQIIDTEFELAERGRIAVRMNLAPLRDADHMVQGVAVVVDDVTEQMQRDLELGVMKRYLPPQMVENIHTISGMALGGEKREVSCLFVEVRSIATMPKGMTPEEMMDEVNVYLSIATECVHRVEGVIDKYMGTDVMALFNTQLNPIENHAERAVEAALMMREEFVKLYARLGINPDPHFYRVGIHTGVATLGNVGSLSRRDFTAIGDTINLSKRLEENATEGQLIISESTHQHLLKHNGQAAKLFQFIEREPMRVKGRQQETRIYEVFRA